MGRTVNLDEGIVDSSLWQQPATVCKVWFTMLAMCHRGVVALSVEALARRANVTVAEARQATAYLEAPDPESRSRINQGRRIEAIEGGWRVLNYYRYNPQGPTAPPAPAVALLGRKETLQEQVQRLNQEMLDGRGTHGSAVGSDGRGVRAQVDGHLRHDPGTGHGGPRLGRRLAGDEP